MNSSANASISQPNIYHVEICLNRQSTARFEDVKEHVHGYLQQNKYPNGDFVVTEFDNHFLKQHVDKIAVSDTKLSQNERIDLSTSTLRYHVYHLEEGGPGMEGIDDEDMAAANHWIMPSRDFEGIWESLVFDEDIKTKLLSYAATTLLFSDKNVDTNIISWNKVVLLHGPPGTGKTSLCKGLAQKLCIRLSDRFKYGQLIEINSHSLFSKWFSEERVKYGQLIEINSHSLFSKWFSESGKLVVKMFQKIQELIDDQEALVCVLIDEVESLTAARKSAMSGSEPSDAIRVVNAVLTQLDQLKRSPNVIILTTSNVTGAIDLAFVDRADIKQFIGPPSGAAIFSIYRSCVLELMRAGIIVPFEHVLDLRTLEFMGFETTEVTRASLQLRDIARKSHGLSGRALRKLPFIAQAMYVQKNKVTLNEFLSSLEMAVEQQFKERTDLTKE